MIHNRVSHGCVGHTWLLLSTTFILFSFEVFLNPYPWLVISLSIKLQCKKKYINVHCVGCNLESSVLCATFSLFWQLTCSWSLFPSVTLCDVFYTIQNIFNSQKIYLWGFLRIYLFVYDLDNFFDHYVHNFICRLK